MTNTDGSWRISNTVYVDFGPDDDLKHYGPGTRHGHEYNPEADAILGRSDSQLLDGLAQPAHQRDAPNGFRSNLNP